MRNSRMLQDAQRVLDLVREMEDGPDALLYAFAHVTKTLGNQRMLEAVTRAQTSLRRLEGKLQ